jgi:regulator of sigma E protease
MVDTLIALLILNIMVIAHELGHFIVAKRNNIGVHEFAIGFGPTLLKKEWKGTLWLIKLFPLGGYNALKGEAEDEGGEGNFTTAPKKAKLKVLVAGSLMNVLMAIVSFYIAIALYGGKVQTPISINPVGAVVNVSGDPYPIAYGYLEGSPASKMGVTLPFSIVSINGKTMNVPADVVEAIANSPTDTVELVVKEKGEQKQVTVIRNADKKIGIQIDGPALQLDYTTNPIHAVFAGFSHSINSLILTKDILGQMIAITFRTKNLEPLGYAFAGPVAIVAAVGDVVDSSKTIFADLANMCGLIGISLAVFNLLPFPGLDGWHIFLIFYEKARGRKPNQKLVGIITGVGLIFLLSLGAVIMLKDVWLFFLKK